MPLFTDTFITTADLLDRENELVTLSGKVGLRLDAKIRLALSDLGVKIQARTVRATNYMVLVGTYGLTPVDYGDQNIPRFQLERLVVTPALKRWAVLYALSLTYADLTNRKETDRYQVKFDYYSQEAQTAEQDYFDAGVGITFANPPALSLVQSGSLEARTEYWRFSFMFDDGSESPASPEAQIYVPAGYVVQIDRSGTSIPAPPRLTAKAPVAVGWYPWASTRSYAQTRQVAYGSQLGMGATTWQCPATGIVDGDTVDTDYLPLPDITRSQPNFIRRG